MRLIDLDDPDVVFCGQEGEYLRYNVWEELKIVDAVPVVRGKWISDGAGYHWTYNCSICGWKDGYPFNERHNYCPNCGADMREDIGGDEDG